jgi:membrane protein implicated in regulation of membrane protease activity
MTVDAFYLTCFVVGFLLSLVSFLAGAAHLHIPTKFHLHVGHAAHGGHGMGHGHGGQGAGRGPQISPLNFSTLTAFLAWFGGVGYLLHRYSNLWPIFAFGLALLSGIGGGAIVFWFLAKVLIAHDKQLDPADFEMTGVVAQVSSPIRQGGTGEILYSQNGVRRCAGARSDTGAALTRGTEVVVTRFEKGIAYVCRWDEFVEGGAKAQAGGGN